MDADKIGAAIEPRRKASKLFDLLCGLLLLPNLMLFWLSYHYEKICPQAPDYDRGIIYPLDEHGTILYLTLAQDRKIFGLELYLFVSVPCFMALGIWKYGLRGERLR
jgi:hypothetical protein